MSLEFQSLASQLKAQLEAARSVRFAQDAKKSTSTSEESEVVVLSRTDRQGMARPLPSRKHAVETKHGRRKKEKVCIYPNSVFSNHCYISCFSYWFIS